jgi:hypothetical protein
MALQLGDVVGEAGKVVRGKYPLIALETGGVEELDVIIATGTQPGPRLLLTGNISPRPGASLSLSADIHLNVLNDRCYDPMYL